MTQKSKAASPRKTGSKGKLALKKKTLKDLTAAKDAKGGVRAGGDSLACSVDCLRTMLICKTR
jgi:hypothetical protein